MRFRVTVRRFIRSAIAAGVLVPASLAAQEAELSAACQEVSGTGSNGAPAREFCNLVAQAVEVAQPRLGLALTGGNPVAGTASTLGMRLGSLPRLSLGIRATGVYTVLPPIDRFPGQGDSDDIQLIVPSVALDGAIGVFSGFSPAPTIGGLGSVDLLASVGLVPIPEGEGFEGGSPMTWAIGARLGLLRESFTMPGVSVSGMYRRFDEVVYGDSTFRDEDSFFRTDASVLSARAAISKRLLFLGATAGVGWDRYSSDVAFGGRVPGSLLGLDDETFRVAFDGFENDRVSAFANLSWTMLILHLVGEVGWQAGSDRVPGELPAGTEFDPEGGTWFGSLALRLSI